MPVSLRSPSLVLDSRRIDLENSSERPAAAPPVPGARPTVARLVVTAVAVAVAYYFGAKIGLVLRFPPAVPSVLWPPNALLTAALLLTPVRWWWVCLAAALPAHFAAELDSAFPAPLVAILFLTNCTEALLAAAGVRLASDSTTRFDSLQRVAVFVVAAALLAPFLSSFPDAAAVANLTGAQFDEVWRTRFFSNVLAQLALVPAIVLAVSGGRSWWSAGWRRRIEAAALTATLAILGTFVFLAPAVSPGLLPGLSRAPLFLLLPPLLWAAVRFGTPGASLSLLATTVLALGAGIGHWGPFATIGAEEGVISVQLALTGVGVPLLFLAGLIEERSREHALLAESLRSLRASEAMKSAILDSVGNGVAVLDSAGRIVTANGHWERAHAETGGDGPGPSGSGADYVEAWRRTESPEAAEVAAGLEAVLSGRRPSYEIEYSRRGPSQPRWFALAAVPLRRFEWGAVVSEVETTNRRRTEVELQRMRQELAHVTRISTVGELTASLAHQLNQPLAAILANSDAGLRYLRDRKADPAEMCAVLSEIGDDVRRASDVIKQLRTLLRKDEVHAGELDLNELARGVLRLVDNDALLRKVRLEFEPAATPPLVHGVAVQLQQVVLNLVVNAFEASAMRADAERRVAVRIADAEGETVELVVEDSGHGLDGHDERIFEPFFTTKAEGMGMGLSIARTIVSSHGGTIAASDNLARGATFRVLLPRSSVSVS